MDMNRKVHSLSRNSDDVKFADFKFKSVYIKISLGLFVEKKTRSSLLLKHHFKKKSKQKFD